MARPGKASRGSAAISLFRNGLMLPGRYQKAGRPSADKLLEVCNLSDDGAELWRPHSHDIVFRRNVLMYFAPASAQAYVQAKPGRLTFSTIPMST